MLSLWEGNDFSWKLEISWKEMAWQGITHTDTHKDIPQRAPRNWSLITLSDSLNDDFDNVFTFWTFSQQYPATSGNNVFILVKIWNI